MISASAAKKARVCERKWGWGWLYPEPQGPEAAEGEAVHLVAQDYQETGKAPDTTTRAGRTFMPALPYVPRPKTGTAEGKFELTISGVPYVGFVDLRLYVRDLPGTLEDARLTPDTPVVLDYKTIKEIKPERMLIGAGAFLNDEQAVLYAARALITHPQAQVVYMRWLYLQRETEPKCLNAVPCAGPKPLRCEGCKIPARKPKAKPQDAVLTRAEVEAAFGAIVHPTASKLYAIRLKGKEALDPLTLRANTSACRMYGPKYPCPHEARCTDLNQTDQVFGTNEEDSMSGEQDIVAMLLAAKKPAAVVTEAPAQVAGVPVAPAAAETPKGINPPENPAKAEAAKTKASKACATPCASGDVSDADLGAAVRVLMRAFKGA